MVIDGTGTAAVRSDIAVTGATISHIGDLEDLEATHTIDCTGRIITPGFIDIHSHTDFLLPEPNHGALLEPFLRQGITTVIGGNCGFSPAPVTDRTRDSVVEASRLIGDEPIQLRWNTMGEFLDTLDKGGVALNLGQLVGHGSVRSAVTGPLNPAPPTAEELAAMERLCKAALDAGCLGISTGLGYPPGIFASEDELTTFAGWAKSAGKLLTSHLRAYSWISPVYQTDPAQKPHNIAAIEEILRVAERASARLQISHLIFVGRNTWPTVEQAIGVIERARDRGLDVAFDAFPYTAGNTTASVLFPPEILPFLEQVLSSPAQMEPLVQMAEAIFGQIGFNLEDIQIMHANAENFDRYDGWFIGNAARDAGMNPWEFYGRMVNESHRNARVLIHKYSGDASDESALEAVLRHPLCSIETDTFITEHGHQNPAAYGTFPRALHTCVKRGLFTLEEAVHKMTGAPADRLGWKDRGFVRNNAPADLVVLNPATLEDTASFAEPARFPLGIEHVFINGVQVVDSEKCNTRLRAGRILRG